ncbi:MAG: NADH-quinone oxidoreductase subunit L [Desulfobacteraceae bacterium]|nr:MAG: NADH-quinone oxidoreductase subunit L [Desulfobacteraceae bacterium]
MQHLWLIPALPLAGFLVLALAGGRLPRNFAAAVGVGSVALSALLTLWALAVFVGRPPDQGAYTQILWRWFEVAGLKSGFSFHIDALALTMMGVITGVGFFIHLYSVGYMAGDESFARFFAYMNLFVGAMLILVMADNLLLLYFGWEGVGLCSYLLIGFWYREPENGYAARKAFVVTRVGDTAMAIGLFLLFDQLGTLQVQELMDRATATWPAGAALPTIAALLLLGGAVGKSAQLPLQTWLPDAMAGPTPVSALIHAATMVTAGVYLIARTHALFLLAPAALTATAVVGALTLLLAGFSALCQKDIKRVLAYSTISQIGYMFLALGVGAWAAAMFHFMTHAFFKALLFLGAGAVIHGLSGEQNLFRMGGLRREMPLTFLTFLAGAAALAALPLITAGFYSKDLIIWEAYAAARGNLALWGAALAGAFITALYTFRMFFLIFEGPLRTSVQHAPGPSMTVPLAVLALLSLLAGFLQIPPTLGGGVHLFSDFLSSALPATRLDPSREVHEALFGIFPAAVVLLGIGLVWRAHRRSPDFNAKPIRSPAGRALHGWWAAGWGFDRLYDLLFVQPYVYLAQVNRNDIIDRLIDLIASLSTALHRLASATQTGRLRNYAAGLAIGAALVIAMVVWA